VLFGFHIRAFVTRAFVVPSQAVEGVAEELANLPSAGWLRH